MLLCATAFLCLVHLAASYTWVDDLHRFSAEGNIVGLLWLFRKDFPRTINRDFGH